MFIPTTAVVTLTGTIAMLVAWFSIRYRIANSHAQILPPVRILHRFFLNMAIFFALMGLPMLTLGFNPPAFPLAMALGYVIGHIFLYAAFLDIATLTFTIVPRLQPYRATLVAAGVLLNVAVTLVTGVTMIWGVRPAFDYVHGVVLFNASPVVGASIGLLALISIVPATILFIKNAYAANGPRRTRSLLIGIGLFALMTAGPLHDVAKTANVYLAADILSVMSILILALGVLYRLEDSLAESPTTAPRYVTPSSNTV